MKDRIVYVHNSLAPSVNETECQHINNLAILSNGSVDVIICDCLDSLVVSDRLERLDEMMAKIKVDGKIVLKTINLKIFAKYILQDRLGIKEINDVLSSVKSMLDDSSTDEILERYPNIRMVESINDGLGKILTLKRV